MAINTRILNQTFNIYRLANTQSDSYEMNPASKVLQATNVKGRIVNAGMAESQREGVQKAMGNATAFKLVLLLETGVDIKAGDYVINMVTTANQYFVDFVDKEPGGTTTHHQEAYLSSSTLLVAS